MYYLTELKKILRSHANPTKAKIYAGFFKTAPGEYGHGDLFLGLTVPKQRTIAKKFYDLSLADIQKLLKSKVHEERFTGLIILVRQFQIGDNKQKKKIYNFYLKNTKRINNWDLVDTSAPQIVGEYLLNQMRETKTPPSVPPLVGEGIDGPLPPYRGEIERGVRPRLAVLVTLARSTNLWERRIAIVATFAFIRANHFDETLKISKLLLTDKHDLIQKACGWMLREVGKKSPPTLKKFLNHHHQTMPRTMLRYAIEKFSKKEQNYYLTSR